jgi:hypothetical protein
VSEFAFADHVVSGEADEGSELAYNRANEAGVGLPEESDAREEIGVDLEGELGVEASRELLEQGVMEGYGISAEVL